MQAATGEEIAKALNAQGVPVTEKDMLTRILSDEVTIIRPSEDVIEPIPDALRGTGWVTFRGIRGEPNVTVSVIGTSGYIPEIPNLDYISINKIEDGRETLINGFQRHIGNILANRSDAVWIVPSFEKYEFITGFEGAVVRLNRINGKNIVSTNSGADGRKSSWERYRIWDAFNRLGLDESMFNELFSSEVKTSPWTYIFMAVTDEFTTSTRQNLSEFPGYIVAFDPIKSMDTNYSTRLIARTSDESRQTGRPYAGPWREKPMNVTDIMTFPYFQRSKESKIIAPPVMNEKQVNQFLETGFYKQDMLPKDPRSWTGESVILVIRSKQEGRNLMYRLMSTSYSYRYGMRGHNPNIMSQYLALMGRDLTPNSIRQMFIPANLLEDLEARRVFEEGFSVIDLNDDRFEEVVRRVLVDYDTRARFVYQQFVASLPISQQKQYADLLENFNSGFETLIRFILETYQGKIDFIDVDKRESLKVIAPAELEKYVQTYPDAQVVRGRSNVNRNYAFYDVSNFEIATGRSVVLLPAPHPYVRNLLNIIDENMRNEPHADRVKMITNIIESNLYSASTNYLYQMIKQANIWQDTKDIMKKDKAESSSSVSILKSETPSESSSSLKKEVEEEQEPEEAFDPTKSVETDLNP